MNSEQIRQNNILLGEAERLLSNIEKSSAEITKEFVNHKIDLIKDINSITAVLLPAIMVFVKEEFINIKILFWIGMVVLVVLLFVNLFYRRSLFFHEEKLLNNLSGFGQKLQDKILDCKKNNDIEDFKRLDVILQDSFKPLTHKKTFFHKYGEIIIYCLFVSGIILISLSLMRF